MVCILDVFTNKILPLFEKSGLTDKEIEKELGLPNTTINDWKRKKTKSYLKYIPAIASYFKVSADYLLGQPDITKDPNYIPFTGNRVKIPVLGVIHAGVPIFADEHIEGYEFAEVSDPENYFFLSIKGDSMIGAHIFEGSFVLFKRQSTAENGQIVACLVDEEDATIKRFRQDGDRVVLFPENSAYSPIFLTCDDFETGYAKILGVAVEMKVKF